MVEPSTVRLTRPLYADFWGPLPSSKTADHGPEINRICPSGAEHGTMPLTVTLIVLVAPSGMFTIQVSTFVFL
jgi:hypothetical protein